MSKEKPTICIDTREKRAFDFEGDEDFAGVEYGKLEVGDYTIKGYEHVVAVERKASVDELYLNFSTKDSIRRMKAEFERMRSCRFKFIVVEASLEDVLNPLKYYVNKRRINKFSPKMPSIVVCNALVNLMLEENVHIIFAGEHAQAITKKILLSIFKNEGK